MMKRIILTVLLAIGILTGVKAANENERMLWGSINGKSDASASAYKSYNNIILLSWRMLPGDNSQTVFDLYRSADGGAEVKLNSAPITGKSNWQDKTADRTKTNAYRLTLSGSSETVGQYTMPAAQASAGLPYIQIDLKGTKDVCALDTIWYEANDVSVGDLDGDGVHEIVVKRLLTHGKDGKVYEGTAAIESPRHVLHTVLYEAYKLDGTFLWRICSGPNIMLGNSSSFAIADFDGDGKCEMAIKTGEGTVFGDGRQIGDTDGDGKTDYREDGKHYIGQGPEFFSVVEGTTGRELARANYITRGASEDWGDDYFKRASSLRVAVANFSGGNPSVLICRGVYERSVLEAWDFDGSSLNRRWHFDSHATGTGKDGKPNLKYASQGFHSLSVGDVDGDGKDEVVYGSMTIDHDGQGLYSSEYGHGDALHLGKFDPSREGLQIWSCQEFGKTMAVLRDAKTGATLWKMDGDKDNDTGRAMIADIDPASPGCEMWWFRSNAHSISGEDLGYQPTSCNMAIWFGSGLNRQLLNETSVHQQYDNTRIFTIDRYDVEHINGTKGNPAWYGDILGDWREEIIMPDATRRNNLKVFSTWYPTDYEFPWLMTDHVYEMSALNQNVGYNMPTQLGYYLGSDMQTDAGAKKVMQETTWTFDDYTEGTVTAFSEKDKLWTRATSSKTITFEALDAPKEVTFADGYTVTVNKIATSSSAYSVSNMASLTAGQESGEDCAPFFAFDTTVEGTCYVYVGGESNAQVRLAFSNGTKATSTNHTFTTEGTTVLSQTSTEAGTFFIGGIKGSKRRDIYAIRFVPATVSEESVVVYIGETGYATFGNTTSHHLTTNDVLTVYSAKPNSEGTAVVLTELEGIPQTEGVILKGEPKTNYRLYYAEEGVTYTASNNYMKRVTSDTQLRQHPDATHWNYILAAEGGIAKFFLVEDNSTLAKGKAYLNSNKELAPAAGSHGIELLIDDMSTSMETFPCVESSPLATDEIYNLRGQRVTRPVKGLYIIHGKKVVIR